MIPQTSRSTSTTLPARPKRLWRTPRARSLIRTLHLPLLNLFPPNFSPGPASSQLAVLHPQSVAAPVFPPAPHWGSGRLQLLASLLGKRVKWWRRGRHRQTFLHLRSCRSTLEWSKTRTCPLMISRLSRHPACRRVRSSSSPQLTSHLLHGVVLATLPRLSRSRLPLLLPQHYPRWTLVQVHIPSTVAAVRREHAPSRTIGRSAHRRCTTCLLTHSLSRRAWHSHMMPWWRVQLRSTSGGLWPVASKSFSSSPHTVLRSSSKVRHIVTSSLAKRRASTRSQFQQPDLYIRLQTCS
mmetsp:Transcript_4879/g.14776  ORF Transcript_4879/g.14776 Transcript_4879/m.14776 type:complete len:295 (-) Transcript_4879:92-976(-)